MESESTLHAIPDDELLRRLGELVSHSRCVEADLVAHIGEVEKRRLYAREASPSMFAYCTERLHLSEAEAYRRITVARAARRHEVLLTMLRDGRPGRTFRPGCGSSRTYERPRYQERPWAKRGDSKRKLPPDRPRI